MSLPYVAASSGLMCYFGFVHAVLNALRCTADVLFSYYFSTLGKRISEENEKK